MLEEEEEEEEEENGRSRNGGPGEEEHPLKNGRRDECGGSAHTECPREKERCNQSS